MNEVNRTLYIPLYGKAEISRRGIIIKDEMAEKIWQREGFELKGKARSKWLCYYMSMRAAVYDSLAVKAISGDNNAVVIHIGCGLDSRIIRTGNKENIWYDVDFPDVIAERRKYFSETDKYKMLGADASSTEWISELPSARKAVIIMEGVSMYIPPEKVRRLFEEFGKKFDSVNIFADVYTVFGARASKYKNPINSVGVTEVFGVDSPEAFESEKIRFVSEHTMTPDSMINELTGFDRVFFKAVFGGSVSKKIYRLYEFVSKNNTRKG